METPSSPSLKLTFHCPPDYNIPVDDGHRYVIVGIDEYYESNIAKQKSYNACDVQPDIVFSKSRSSLLSTLSTPTSSSSSDDSLLAPIFASRTNSSLVAGMKDPTVYLKKCRKKNVIGVVDPQN